MSKMNKFISGAASTINTVGRAMELSRQVEAIKNSKLPLEEKNKALQSLKRIWTATILFLILITIPLFATIFISFFKSYDLGIIVSLISLVILIITLLLFVFILRHSKLPFDWRNAYEKVKNGFDGLSDEEINYLKPNVKEKSLIKKYKRKTLLFGLTILFATILSIYIAVYLQINPPVTVFMMILIIIVCCIAWDNYDNKIHKLESGYYKRSVDYLCKNCQSKVKIDFKDLENISLPRNEEGIRIMKCSSCGDPVPLYNFDICLNEYKKYLEKIK